MKGSRSNRSDYPADPEAFSIAGGEWAIIPKLPKIYSRARPGRGSMDRKDVENASIIFQNLMESLLAYEDSLYNDERVN